MNKIRMMFLAAFAVIVLGGGLITSPAFGVTYFPPITVFEDDDLDWLIKADGNTQAGIIEEGDRLVGVVEYNLSFGAFGGGPAPILPDELTGVFDITVVDKIDNLNGTFDFIFGPTAGSTFLDPLAPAGTMVSVYLDGTPNLTINPPSCGDLATCIAQASDGNLYLNLGFNGDANELWVALDAFDDTTFVANQPGASKLGVFNFFLNILTNNTGQTFVAQNCSPLCPAGGDNAIDLIGSGDILGGQGLSNGAFARSDTDVQLQTEVPEPSTLLLLGSGLLGLAFISRRRRNK